MTGSEHQPLAPAAAAAVGGLEPGFAIGEYRIEEPLGKGGMGAVYAARQPEIGARVAIKVLDADRSRDPRLVRRFVDEARAVNQIRHPNIIDIFAFGRLADGRHHFVMEHLEGETLAARLARGPLPVTDARRLLGQICEALAAVHAEAVVHRDPRRGPRPPHGHLRDGRPALPHVERPPAVRGDSVRRHRRAADHRHAGATIDAPAGAAAPRAPHPPLPGEGSRAAPADRPGAARRAGRGAGRGHARRDAAGSDAALVGARTASAPGPRRCGRARRNGRDGRDGAPPLVSPPSRAQVPVGMPAPQPSLPAPAAPVLAPAPPPRPAARRRFLRENPFR